jgi:hypothetical protein
LITWTAAADEAGENNVVVQVSDGRGGSDLQSFIIVVVDEDLNRPPQVTSEAITTAVVFTPYEYRIRAFDPDEDDSLSFELKAGPGGMSLSDIGLVEWMPPVESADQAVLVQVEISDGEAAVLHSWVIEVSADGDLDPVADAGFDRTVDPGVIELDGSASRDPMAGELRYLWAFVEGPSEALIDDTSLQIATVELLYPGEYRFKLTVTGSGDRSAEDEVVISVRYGGPIAIAGEDQRIEFSATGEPVAVTLAGEAIVLDSDNALFDWRQVGGPEVGLDGADSASPTFKAPDPGLYIFELRVSDGELTSVPDTVVISVVEPDQDSAANWGVDETACGCAGSPFGDAAWLLFLLPALRRRRRSSAV